MAQTAGILVGEARNFEEKVILAKVKRAVFHHLVLPGDTIRHEARIEQLSDQGASTAGRITVGDTLVGEVDIFFSHIDQNISGLEFPQQNFVFTEEFMSLLNAFRARGGERITL
jgi:3-hydroxyacyl-[acyl-carrier-protein] dehydratase